MKVWLQVKKKQGEEMLEGVLADKVVLVTGAGGGIGREIALLMGASGAD